MLARSKSRSLTALQIDDQAVSMTFYSILTGVTANEEKRRQMVVKGLWKKGTRKAKIQAPKTHMRKRELACRLNNGPSDLNKEERIEKVAALYADEKLIDEMLKDDSELVEDKWQQKYKDDAVLYWDHFYKQRTTNFYKDRHYLRTEFTELMPPEVVADPKKWIPKLTEEAGSSSTVSSTDLSIETPPPVDAACFADRTLLLEVGCAVGNAVFPLLRANPALFIFACDLSPVAVDFVRQNAEYDQQRCFAFSCDITKDEQPHELSLPIQTAVPAESLDFVTMVFVLSAIAPEEMPRVLQRMHSRLKPRGMLIIRDYGKHDLAQLRFPKGQKLEDSFYVRGDGTLAYYFDMDFLCELFESCGFEKVECKWVTREIENRKRGITMHRVWIQGKFKKCGE